MALWTPLSPLMMKPQTSRDTSFGSRPLVRLTTLLRSRRAIWKLRTGYVDAGPRALVVMISQLVRAYCFKLKWALAGDRASRSRCWQKGENEQWGAYSPGCCGADSLPYNSSSSSFRRFTSIWYLLRYDYVQALCPVFLS